MVAVIQLIAGAGVVRRATGKGEASRGCGSRKMLRARTSGVIPCWRADSFKAASKSGLSLITMSVLPPANYTRRLVMSQPHRPAVNSHAAYLFFNVMLIPKLSIMMNDVSRFGFLVMASM